VLTHMMGHLKKMLSSDEKNRNLLLLSISTGGGTRSPRVPVTLVRHYVRKHGIAYLARQVFLDPHPWN